jgi:hypothetical protein
MPTILRSGPYRVYFWAHEANEPAHVHVDRDDRSAKFWLAPIMLTRNDGFARHELNAIERLLTNHQKELIHAWNEMHGTKSR